MDDSHCIPYKNTRYFSRLITDYLAQKPELHNLYNQFPSLKNYSSLAQSRNFPAQHRKVLTEVLRSQYASYQNDSEAAPVWEHIATLEKEQTFTITTGHQLNIFTGPLYFIYKIITAINTAQELNKVYPQRHFVPVYWMASEDHDFEEINHINLHGGVVRWPSEQEGKVGDFETDTLKPAIDQLAEQLGPGQQAEQWITLVKEAYLKHDNLAKATRHLAHQLFKKYGLVILDADDARLKKLFKPYMKEDLLEHTAQQMVEPTTQYLEKHYFKQVHARSINLFYTGNSFRKRIEKQDNTWQVVDSDLSFTHNEILNELNEHPERFSPNVVLRPLYQEVILPNLGYVGGGGELAYWLQLKAMFDHFAVPFPALHLRNSVLLLKEKQGRKKEKLALSWEHFFKGKDHTIKNLVSQISELDTNLGWYEERLQQMFDEMENLATKTDKGMIGAVKAQRQKQLNGLENMKKKLLRAEKRQYTTAVRQATELHEALFPNGGLQERHANISLYYAGYGKDLLEHLRSSLHPFEFCFRVVLLNHHGTGGL